ncbi:IS21 family transposase [Burkholderia stabilis]|uniref:IS21 family transposase n=1 Tax=Burkholderia stabilis TaxID=95485 RepID=UPI0015900697|nr:IS21 family transposase [Burkholderia stabilis]
MNAVASGPDSRHGSLAEFTALTDGLTISKIAEVLRCCARSVQNWIKGRSPIPWHRIEVLRIWRATVCSDPAAPNAVTLPDGSALADVVTDEQELLAWVCVHAPHFLSRRSAFDYYVRGWDVAGKVRHAKANGSFRDVLLRWRTMIVERVREWRSGPLFPNPKDDFPPQPPDKPHR